MSARLQNAAWEVTWALRHVRNARIAVGEAQSQLRALAAEGLEVPEAAAFRAQLAAFENAIAQAELAVPEDLIRLRMS